MAANLTPQYLEAETEYKKAQTAEERLACLKKMWSLLPKHKASEKLQAELKKKISDTREEVEHQQQKGKKGSFQRPGASSGCRPGHPGRRAQHRQEPAVDALDPGHARSGTLSIHHARSPMSA